MMNKFNVRTTGTPDARKVAEAIVRQSMSDTVRKQQSNIPDSDLCQEHTSKHVS